MEKYRGQATFIGLIFMVFLLTINHASRCWIGYKTVLSKTYQTDGERTAIQSHEMCHGNLEEEERNSAELRVAALE